MMHVVLISLIPSGPLIAYFPWSLAWMCLEEHAITGAVNNVGWSCQTWTRRQTVLEACYHSRSASCVASLKTTLFILIWFLPPKTSKETLATDTI